MSAHTRGPWHFQRSSKNTLHIGVYGTDGSSITLVRVAADFQFERRFADASLIAAAPDLLAALVKCEVQLSMIVGMVHDERCALTDARIAIAKATGATS